MAREMGVVRFRKRAVAVAIVGVLGGAFASFADAPTYYVSTSGNDNNDGLTPATAWATVAKVDAASLTFTPGTDVLFQRGDVWGETLLAGSSGNATAPITYSAYGDTSLAKPEFLGSDVVSGFTSLGNSTYVVTTPVVSGAVYLNHDFMHSATLLAGTGDPTQYVLSNPDTYYYNTSSNQLIVNTGGVSLTNSVVTATRRTGVVNSNGQSYLVFDNLQTDETASSDTGFGFVVGGGSNVTVQNSDAFRAGKHHFEAINTTNFVGKNLNAEYTMPDLGLATGGSSAYVSYGDIQGPSNQTYEWDNVSASNLDGGEALITHGASVAKVTINNIHAPGLALGLGSDVQSGAVTINGGVTGDIFAASPGTVIDGTTVQAGTIYLQGMNQVVQNVLMHGLVPVDGFRAAVVITGTNDTVRYSTIGMEAGPGNAADIYFGGGNASIYGNIFFGPGNYISSGNSPSLYSDHNLFASDPTIQQFTGNQLSYAQWLSMGFDNASIVADPQFVDAANGDYSLQASSPAIGPYFGAFWQLITHDAFGNARPSGGTIDLGAEQRAAPSYIVYSAAADGDLGDAGAPVSLNGDMLLITGDTFHSTNRTISVGVKGGTLFISSATNTFAASNLQIAGPVSKDGDGTLLLPNNYNNTATTLIVDGTLELAGPANKATDFFGAGTLRVDAGATLVASGIAVSTVVIHGHVQIQRDGIFEGTSIITNLVLDGGTGNWTTGIDIMNNHLIIEDSANHAQTLAQIRDQAAYGQTHQEGIYSSVVTAGKMMVVVDNAYFGKTFYNGTDVDSGSIIVYSTYKGDANMDGAVDLIDLQTVANHWQQPVHDWSQGDFDGNGVVDLHDLQVVANNWQAGSNLAGGSGSGSSDIASLFAGFLNSAPVPEPGTLGVMVSGVLLLMRRRK